MSGIIKSPVGARPKKDHPLVRGLVGAWLFNEGSGNVVSDCGGVNNHGTIYGTLSWQGGKHGYAYPSLSTDATKYIKIADDPSLESTILTVEWLGQVKTTAAGYLVAKRVDATTQWFLYLDTSRPLLKVGATSMLSATAINDNKYHHIFGVMNGASSKIYVDGKLVQSGTTGAMSDTTIPIHIGVRGDAAGGAYPFNGNTSLVRLYNRELSAEEVATLSAFPYAMFEEESPYWVWKVAAESNELFMLFES